MRFTQRKLKHYFYAWKAKQQAAVSGSLVCQGKVKLTGNTYLGENVNFNGASVFGQGKVTIGDNFHSGSGLKLMTSYHNYQGATLPYDNTEIIGDITIGDNVWIGENVTILAGVTIGEGAVIQLGSVVSADIPPLSIAGGHPARVFKQRDEQHYQRLKAAGAWHYWN